MLPEASASAIECDRDSKADLLPKVATSRVAGTQLYAVSTRVFVAFLLVKKTEHEPALGPTRGRPARGRHPPISLAPRAQPARFTARAHLGGAGAGTQRPVGSGI